MDRAHVVAGGVVATIAAVLLLLITPAFVSAQEADPATKRLLAANGLFQRQLYKLAAEQYSEFLRDNPQHAEASTARYAMAVCHFRLGDHEKAAAGLIDAMKAPAFKHTQDAMLVLGHCYLAQKDHPKALATLDQLLSKYPKSDQAEPAHLTRAQVLFFMDRKADAAAACDAFLKAHPTSRYRADAMLLLGQSLEATGQADAAAAQYQKLIAAPSSRQAEAYLALGMLQYRKASYADVIDTLSKLIAAHPSSPYVSPARLQLGLAQVAAGQLDTARQTLAEVARTDTARAATARYWLAQCDIAEKKFDAALKTLHELAQVQPPLANSDRIAMDRGQCLMALGRYQEAAEQFAAFTARYPTSQQLPEAHYRQAFCMHKLGQYQQSLDIGRKLKFEANHPLAIPAAELTGENSFLLNQYQQAASIFGQLMTSPSSTEQRQRYTLRLGQCAYFTGDYAKTIELLQPLAQEPVRDEEILRGQLLLGDALLQTGRSQDAVQVLAKYVPMAKKDKPEAQFKLALAQLRSNDAAAAERTLLDAMSVSDSPWAMRATFEFGQLKYRQKEPAKAAIALRKVADNASPELAAPAAYLLAWIEFDANRHAAAAEQFARMTAKYPQDPLAGDALFYQGAALKEAGGEDKAIPLFENYLKAHATGQHALKARQMIASCLVKLERHEQATKALTALAADPATATDEVLYDLAWTQQAMKKSGDAEQTYRRLLGQYPASRLAPSARSELAEILYQQQKYPDAMRLLARVVSDPSADAKTIAVALYRLGSCYEKLGDPAQAAATYTNFLARHGNDELAVWAHYQAGINLLKQNKLPEAQQHFEKVLAGSPKPDLATLAMLKLGETHAQAGNYDVSRKIYQQFIEKYPNDKLLAQAQFGIGWAAENQKQYEEARRWYQKVIAASNTPTAARAQFQIGETYFAEGQLERAAAALLAVADVYAYPDWAARALFEAGRVFEQMKQPQQARQQYEQVISKYKDSPEAALAEKRLKAMN